MLRVAAFTRGCVQDATADEAFSCFFTYTENDEIFTALSTPKANERLRNDMARWATIILV